MSFINKYPYTDFHELNLDWVLAKMRELGEDMDEFKALNTITFSGVWDITKQYPAWTVVNDNNLGYISIKPVPAGIVISNTDYWASIVDYSAELAGIHSDITNLQNDVATINAELAAGKWLFLGDSYQDYGGWYGQVIAAIGLTDQVNAFYAGVSGHGFTVSGGEWVNDMIGFCTGRTDLSEFKHVVIVGGLNDSDPTVIASDGAILRPAIDTFVTTMLSLMPNAKLSVAYVGSACEDSPVLFNRTAANRAEAIHIYKDELTKLNQEYLQNCEYSMHSYSFFASDMLHPSTYAGSVIAGYVAEAIINKSCHVYGNIDSAADTYFTTGELHAFSGVMSRVDNGRSSVTFRALVIQNSSVAASIGSTPIDFGELPANVFIRNTKAIQSEIQVSNAGAADRSLVYIQIINRHLYVSSGEFTAGPSYKQINIAVGDRIDFNNVTFDEFTLFTM